MLDSFLFSKLGLFLVHFKVYYFADPTSIQAFLNSKVTYNFNELNFQFTLKVKPIVENQMKKKISVDFGWKPFTHIHNCSTKTTLQVPSTSGDANNQ